MVERTGWVVRVAVLALGYGLAACGTGEPAERTFEALAAASLSRIEGELAVPGLRAEVEVLRDEWGVPHIYAEDEEDLFFAQGFVQAQDRLWQMEMYRRTAEGRLSEILGPSAFEHDRLSRLMAYRGPFDDAEWTSYHPRGRRIFEAFAAGVNAYIAHAGERLPVEFILTGIRPEPWTAEASVVRVQTAMPLGDAFRELRLAMSVAEHGVEEANRRARPDPWRPLEVPRGLDVSIITDEVVRALAGMQSGMPRPELLPEYRTWVDALASVHGGAREDSPGSNNWVLSGALTESGRVLLANDPHRAVTNPSLRYVIHLVAPGWNVIGASEPPLPGVSIGHNGRVGWGLTIVGTDQADVYVEEVDPDDRNRVRWRDGWEPLRVVVDTIRIRGEAPRVVEFKYSRHGPIFHEDTVNHRAYAVRSTMHEPGTGGYLAALRLAQVSDCVEFLDALAYYKAPSENMLCGDADGNIAWQASALTPKRRGWDGRLPVPGTGEYEWDGWRDDLPRELNPARGWIATANHNIHPADYDPPLFFRSGPYPRFERLAERIPAGRNHTIEDSERLQHDAYSAAAAADLTLFRGWTGATPELEWARGVLAGWDATFSRGSAAAALYGVFRRRLDPAARERGTPGASRETLVRTALAEAFDSLTATLGEDTTQWRWGRIHRSEFPHSLVRAYDIPSVERDGGAGTVAATGATFRQIIDFADLDRSVATNAPGQSGQPGSPFYSDLAAPWAAQQYFPLLYSRTRVEERTRYRLLLRPPRG